MAIDRRALVRRHDVVLTAPDSQLPLSVGNGDFACTVDITGMQTFTEFHDPRSAGQRPTVNTCTQSTWGWHEMPNPSEYRLADVMTAYETVRGPVEYPDDFDMMAMFTGDTDPAKAPGIWLHVNPHRIDLGRVGLVLRRSPDEAPETDPSVLTDVRQRLDLWSGTIESSFGYAGEPVRVSTVAHPERAGGRLSHRVRAAEHGPARRATVVPVRQRSLPVHERLGRPRPALDAGHLG